MNKICDKCNVTVRGAMSKCPLCQSKLIGDDNSPCYPVINTVYKQFERFFKLLMLVTIGIGIAAISVNMILPSTGFWSLFVLFGIVCFWIMLAIAIRRRYNIPKNIATQVVLISIFSVIWDYVTGWHGWSFDYVIPITCGTAMISLAVVGKVMHLPITDYMVSMLADTLFGIVPAIFYLTGVLNVRIPSVICIAVSLISFFAILIFEGRNMLKEIQKRLHL